MKSLIIEHTNKETFTTLVAEWIKINGDGHYTWQYGVTFVENVTVEVDKKKTIVPKYNYTLFILYK